MNPKAPVPSLVWLARVLQTCRPGEWHMLYRKTDYQLAVRLAARYGCACTILYRGADDAVERARTVVPAGKWH